MGKRKQSDLSGLLDTGSELTLIPGDQKSHSGPPIKVGAYGSQMINEVLVQVCLTVGPLGPRIHPVDDVWSFCQVSLCESPPGP